MIVLLAAHFAAALAAPTLVRVLGRRALSLLALVPAAAAVWAAFHTRAAFSAAPPTEYVRWIPGLDMDLWFRLDPLSWLMTLIVGGVGALVLVYASGYFADSSAGLGRFAGVFVGFAGAMLGVVTVDQSMGLYMFWEATSLLSFLLIGHHHDRRPARAAARQALFVTSSGSLAMFTGFVMLGLAPGGSFRLSQLVAAAADRSLDVTSPQVVVGAVLVLLGAFCKSALVPFHFWLPGAMAAPTPVSAYLHAAAMVKAGVYLVARLTPGFTEIGSWSPIIVTVGLATMLVGGWRALRQHDLKLVLAYGTVSQLGLIMAAVGQGSAGAMAAGLTLLVAHSFFKSTLFLTVGAVESATGTRDLRHLSGLARHKPVLAGAAGLAALSMAGMPLTTGFLGKEALLSVLLHGSSAVWTGAGAGDSGPATVDLVVAAVVALGSALTVAYSWRAWWGAFGSRGMPEAVGPTQAHTPTPTPAEPARSVAPALSSAPASGTPASAAPAPASGTPASAVSVLPSSARFPAPSSSAQFPAPSSSAPAPTPATPTPAPTPRRMTVPICVLSLGALLGLAPHLLDVALGAHGSGLSAAATAASASSAVTPALPGAAHLAWWSGWEPALATGAVLVLGVALAVGAARVEALQARLSVTTSVVDLYSWTLRELEITAARVTRVFQRGSLPFDLSTILVTLSVAVAGAMIVDPPARLAVRWYDSALQLGIGVLIIVAAVMTARSRRRMRAAISLGAVGLGVAVLYASQGAPDLALTQVVVESVSIVVFVLVLRKLPRYFSDRPLASSRWWHLAIGVVVGAGTVLGGLYATSARVHPSVSGLMPNEAEKFGNGLNIVNVILVDIRAWDTVGELSVLLVTATGVASLVYLRSRSGRIDRAPSTADTRSFLPAVSALRPQDRSIVLEVTTRLLFPTMLVLSVWLLLIGHNSPGGGFAGGVVAGLAFVLRYLAGGRHELGEAMPIPPGRVMGLGLFIAGAGAMSPLLFGNAVLQSVAVDLHLGVLGDLHFSTAMVLDIGVYVLVVGLVLDLVSATGAEVDRQTARPVTRTPRPDGGGTVDEGGAGLVGRTSAQRASSPGGTAAGGTTVQDFAARGTTMQDSAARGTTVQDSAAGEGAARGTTVQGTAAGKTSAGEAAAGRTAAGGTTMQDTAAAETSAGETAPRGTGDRR